MMVLRNLTTAGTSAFGILLAHLLDYLIVVPDHIDRHRVLTSSGHGYFQTALVIATAVLLVSLISAFSLGFEEHRNKHAARLSVGSKILRLATVQSLCFIGLELFERLAAGGSYHRVGSLPIVGVLIQVLVAALGGFVLDLTERAGGFLAKLLSKCGPRAISNPLALGTQIRLDSRYPSAISIRGPPLL